MACGVCARSTRRAASLPGEGSTHLRGCGMTAVGTNAKRRLHRATSEFGGEAENICSHRVFRILTPSGR